MINLAPLMDAGRLVTVGPQDDLFTRLDEIAYEVWRARETAYHDKQFAPKIVEAMADTLAIAKLNRAAERFWNNLSGMAIRHLRNDLQDLRYISITLIPSGVELRLFNPTDTGLTSNRIPRGLVLMLDLQDFTPEGDPMTPACHALIELT